MKIRWVWILQKVDLLCLVFPAVLYYFLLKYLSKIFFVRHLLEPAENENIFIIDLLKRTHAFRVPDSATLAQAGVFPIYPVLFHQIASWIPGEAIASGRVLSVFMYFAFAALFSFVIFKKTKNFLLATVGPMILLVGAPEFSYLFMNRVDAFFICTGLMACLIADNFETLFKGHKKAAVGAVAVLSAISFLTKQTAVFFPVLCFLSLAVGCFKIKKMQPLIYFSGVFFFVVLFYIIFFDSQFFDKYKFGLHLFAEIFQKSWVQYHYDYYKENELFLLRLAGFVAVGSVFSGKIFQRDLIYCLVIIAVTYKMWGNQAAFSNNFFLVNFAFIYFVVNRIGYFHSILKTGSGIWLCYGLLVCLFFTTVTNKNIEKLTERLSPKVYTEIDQFVVSHPGQYLTSRTDNYAINNGSSAVFEGSIGLAISSSLFNDYPVFQKNKDLEGEFWKLREEIKNKLINKSLQGVILGIQKEDLITLFPEIKIYYEPFMKEEVQNGPFNIQMTLYTPKKN